MKTLLTSPAVGSGSTAASFQVDPAHSAVVLRCIHLGISQAYGRFDEFGGEVVFDEADLSQSSIQVSIQATSMDTNHEQRDTHLRSPDFLCAKENPEIRFVSTKIGGTADELEIEGDLTFHGQTHSVQATGAVIGAGNTPFGDHRVGFEVRFTIDMADYGIEFVKQNPGAVGPEVDLTISLECIRQ